MHLVNDRKSKQLHCQLNTDLNYIRFKCVAFKSKEYFKVIGAINDCYKKMLEIGKCVEVFQPDGGWQAGILTAKSKMEFMKEKENIRQHYNQYFPTGAPRLSILLMLKLYWTQENVQTPNSHCLPRGKYLPKKRFLSMNL